MRTASLALLAVLLASHARAADPYVHPKHYVCYQATAPLTIDGKLDDASWKSAAWTDEFADIEGDKKPRPRFRTWVKMLWDDRYFYIAADMEEPHVWGTLTRHDSVIFHDNDFEVFIDPDGDNHEYYEFEINALNTGWDLLLPRPYKDGGRALFNWEIPGLQTAVHVQGTLNDPRDTDGGWSVELAFPWAVLREWAGRPAPPRDGDQWRVDFSRVEWEHTVVDGKYQKIDGKPEDNWVWAPQGVINMHRPESWGYVQFSTAEPGTAKFHADPAGAAKHLLHQVYYAQHAFRARHRRWANDLKELDLAGLTDTSLTAPVRMQSTASLLQVTAEITLPGGETRRWHIRQDSKLWSD